MEAPNQLVVVSPDALRSLVRTAVTEALAEHQGGDTAPELLGRTDTARALGVSTSMLDRLRKDGLPCVWLGDSPRFQVASCIDWLQRRRSDAGELTREGSKPNCTAKAAKEES